MPLNHAECNDKKNQCDKKIIPKVINLLSLNSSSAQISLLVKGLKFTPTTRPHLTGLTSDMKAFAGELGLYFSDVDESCDLNSSSYNESGKQSLPIKSNAEASPRTGLGEIRQ